MRLTSAEYSQLLARRAVRDLEARGEPIKTPSRGSEADLREHVLEEIERRGWIALYGNPARRTHRVTGEPDIIVVADRGRVIFCELKNATGKLRPEQQAMAAQALRLGHTFHTVRSLAQFLALVDAK